MLRRRVTRWTFTDLSRVDPVLSGNVLDLNVRAFHPDNERRARSNNDFLPDHGHLMHLYAIREPEMDAVFHLHPELASAGDFRISLPAMPAGDYTLYGDVVHATGFPETLVSKIVVPANMPGGVLGPDDAAARPQPLSAGELGNSFTLPDGYVMVSGPSFDPDCKHRLHLPLPTSGCQRQASG